MKHAIFAAIAVLLAASLAHADRLMTFSEVEKCVSMDIEIAATDMKLSETKTFLDGRRKELAALKSSMDKLKAEALEKKTSGDINAYNTLVESYNSIADDYNRGQERYEMLYKEFESVNTRQADLKARFKSVCDNRKIHKPDLRKACRESQHSDTPFCLRNIQRIDE